MKNLTLAMLVLFVFTSCKAQSADDIIERNAVVDSNAVIMPGVDHPTIDVLISRILSNHHYKTNKMNDSLSSVIFDNYIESLDNNKMYFLQEDLDKFSQYRYRLDEDIQSGNLEAAYEIFNLYKKRLGERINDIKIILGKEFDFTIDEMYTPDRENENWCSSREELLEVWRKRLKNEALNLVLSKKEWPKIVELLNKRYQNYHGMILRYREEDVFQLYMNAMALAIDPHTNYFSPITSENFKIGMQLSLEGIGATLRYIDDYTTVQEIVPGGPAHKAANLFANDRIVAIGQGEDGEMVDVVGWRTDDVVQLIRGDKGTVVKLEILRADATIDMPTETITIVRDKVKLVEQAATKEVIDITEEGVNYRLGVVTIPSFYIDFEAKMKGDPDYKSTTRDVQKLLEELKEEKVDGIIVDLRNNGGGALQEAIELAGLFIEEGPVVQVRNSNQYVEVGRDPDKGISYGGPLAVIINKFSASASEIFSGAIQDYERGLVIGNTTYGKGTVQNLIDLERFIKNPRQKTGQLKLTIAKYYRITGSSTQNMGVKPDIEFPDVLSSHEYGESTYPSALPWDQIGATEFTKWGDFSSYLSGLISKHEKRINSNPEFQYIFEDIEEYNNIKNKKDFSLNAEKRKAEREKAELKRKKREEERALVSKPEVEQKGEVTIRNLNIDDPYLEETGHILANLISAVKS